MSDTVPPDVRTRIMASVPRFDTKPELIVRRRIHSMGFRFRLNVKGLPGTPDIVLPRHKKVIFVNGCFWHGHHCRRGRRPKSNRKYWDEKLDKNIERDKRKRRDLKKLGWSSLVIWECQIQRPDYLSRKIGEFLNKNAC